MNKSKRATYERIAAKFGDFFSKHFTHYVCAFDDPEVANRKPEPDVYLVAKKRFANPPESMENVLIFEDSLTGLKGALASEGKVVFISLTENQIVTDEDRELVGKANMKIKSLENFVPEYFGLPPYDH